MSLYGKLEKAQGAQRLRLARSIQLYTQIDPAQYTAERLAALFKRARLTRFDSRLPKARYS